MAAYQSEIILAELKYAGIRPTLAQNALDEIWRGQLSFFDFSRIHDGTWLASGLALPKDLLSEMEMGGYVKLHPLHEENRQTIVPFQTRITYVIDNACALKAFADMIRRHNLM